jgi:sulfur relay (sulfurtransferase) DsrF/TusC family protein
MKTTSVIISQSPLKTLRVAEALRMSVGLTLCDDRVQVLFMADGVYTLLDTKPETVGMPEYSRHIETLRQLNHRLFAEREALNERAIAEIRPEAEVVSRMELAQLLLDSDCVIRY